MDIETIQALFEVYPPSLDLRKIIFFILAWLWAINWHDIASAYAKSISMRKLKKTSRKGVFFKESIKIEDLIKKSFCRNFY